MSSGAYRLDTMVGMGVSNLVALFIVLNDRRDLACARRDECRKPRRTLRRLSSPLRVIWPSWSSRWASSARDCSRCRFCAGSLRVHALWRERRPAASGSPSVRAGRRPSFGDCGARPSLGAPPHLLPGPDPIKALIFSAFVVNGVAAVLNHGHDHAYGLAARGHGRVRPSKRWLRLLRWTATRASGRGGGLLGTFARPVNGLTVPHRLASR